MGEHSEIDSANPYQPPVSAPMLNVVSRRFVCPHCETALPFSRIWLMQPIGRCPICRTRLVVRRHGWHKLWTPGLLTLCIATCFALATSFGVNAIFFAPLLLTMVASLDAAIAFKIGYFDRPKWLL